MAHTGQVWMYRYEDVWDRHKSIQINIHADSKMTWGRPSMKIHIGLILPVYQVHKLNIKAQTSMYSSTKLDWTMAFTNRATDVINTLTWGILAKPSLDLGRNVISCMITILMIEWKLLLWYTTAVGKHAETIRFLVEFEPATFGMWHHSPSLFRRAVPYPLTTHAGINVIISNIY